MCHSQVSYRPTRLPGQLGHLVPALQGLPAAVRLEQSALPVLLDLKGSRVCQATQDPWALLALKASARKALR